MAEGFARAYGSDVIIPASAGLTPAASVSSNTISAMADKGLNLRDHFPKHIKHLERVKFDLVINMSGFPLAVMAGAEVRAWDVDDPVCMEYADHCAVRDEIERLVMELILELRRVQRAPDLRRFGSSQNR